MAEEHDPPVSFVRRALGVFVYSRRALELVWTTSRTLTITLALLTLVAGVLPAVIAFIGQLIIDGVVAAMTSPARQCLWTSAGSLPAQCGNPVSPPALRQFQRLRAL